MKGLIYISTVIYAKLTKNNFDEHSLDSFERYQEIKQSLRKINDEYIYIDNPFTENWDSEQRRRTAENTVKAISDGAIAYGAFREGVIAGFAYTGTERFGTENQYLELKMFQVSNGFRGRGIGKALFALICADAKESGAEKLYISAHSSRESQEAYKHLGCVHAAEINQQIAEDEPCDIQMEFVL